MPNEDKAKNKNKRVYKLLGGMILIAGVGVVSYFGGHYISDKIVYDDIKERVATYDKTVTTAPLTLEGTTKRDKAYNKITRISCQRVLATELYKSKCTTLLDKKYLQEKYNDKQIQVYNELYNKYQEEEFSYEGYRDLLDTVTFMSFQQNKDYLEKTKRWKTQYLDDLYANYDNEISSMVVQIYENRDKKLDLEVKESIEARVAQYKAELAEQPYEEDYNDKFKSLQERLVDVEKSLKERGK